MVLKRNMLDRLERVEELDVKKLLEAMLAYAAGTGNGTGTGGAQATAAETGSFPRTGWCGGWDLNPTTAGDVSHNPLFFMLQFYH